MMLLLISHVKSEKQCNIILLEYFYYLGLLKVTMMLNINTFMIYIFPLLNRIKKRIKNEIFEEEIYFLTNLNRNFFSGTTRL